MIPNSEFLTLFVPHRAVRRVLDHDTEGREAIPQLKAMLRYALEALGGRFPEKAIREGLGVTRKSYRQARGKLERAGVLVRGENNALLVKEGIAF